MNRREIHMRFATATALWLIVLTLGTDALARVLFGNVPWSEAIPVSSTEWLKNPVRLVLLALPVIGAHLLAVEFARATSLLRGFVLLCGTLAMLGGLYLLGFLGFHESIALKKWTAATLSLGLLPVYGTAILVIPLVAAVVAEKRRKARERK